MASEPNKATHQKRQKIQSNDKDIYFIILNRSEDKINFFDSKCLSEINSEIIYYKRIKKEKDSFLIINVFKITPNKRMENKNLDKYLIQYENGEELYDILFDIKENMFIYELKLQKYNRYIKNLCKNDIIQNQIEIQNKMEIFYEALKKNNEINKIEVLFEEGIELYKSKKNFTFLIFLFLKLYKLHINLCSLLIDTFKEINGIENTDRDKNLIKKLDTFNQIYSNSKNIIEESKYNPISFYGIIFCYLSSYDRDNFSKIIKEFPKENVQILYEILIIYYSHLKNPLNQNFEFYNNFIIYAINTQITFELFKQILNYIDDIETFLYVLNNNKYEILKNYDNLDSRPIRLDSNLKLIKKEYIEENQIKPKTELDNIIILVEEMLDFSKENSILLIYLGPSFWTFLLHQYNKSDIINIDNCYRLRKLFKKYKDLINTLFKNNADKKKLTIKDEINRYNDIDVFAFNLNNNIKQMLEINNNKFNDKEKFGIIIKYNPYYNDEIEEDIIKYKNLRQTDIFDNIDFKKQTKGFIKAFRYFNFEELFKGKINEFICKITSKIIDISTLGTVIGIIDITRLTQDNKTFYINILKEKYEYIIKKEIESLKEGKELNKAIIILSNFICLIFDVEKNTIFLEEKIKKLNYILQKLIYFELIKRCNDEKYETIKDYIFNLFLENLKEHDRIIELIRILNGKDKSKFIEKLMSICKFEKNEFYSNYENDKIKLLCKLNELEKPIITENNCSIKIQITLDNIIIDLEKNLITKKQLEEFLNEQNAEGKKEQKEEYYKNKTIQKLSLIKIIIHQYDAIEKYKYLKRIITDINYDIKELNYIKNSLAIFHKNIYRNQIRNLINIINDLETKKIKEFYTDIIQQDIHELLKLKPLCDEINKVKDFLFFKKIFEKSKGKDEKERFKDALNNLNKIKQLLEELKFDFEELFKFNFKEKEDSKKIKNIFESIKDEISKKDELYIDKFINQMISYLNIKDENNKKDFIILIKSKKYEIIIKSIKFFIENCFNKKLINLTKDLELSKMNLTALKSTLKDLKDKNIFDYNYKSSSYKIFISFNNKRESIDFLLSQNRNNFDDLKNKLFPTDRTISIKDIDDANECLIHFKQFINKNGLEIIEHINNLNEETINKIVNYSKNYSSIIDLDITNEIDIFKTMYIIIENARLIFKLDNENFYYTIDNKIIQINLEELIDLKNKIFILPKKTDNIDRDNIKDVHQLKMDKLFYFKEIISNIEEIYEKIKLIRKKGYLIPILINIEIQYPKVSYIIDKEEKDFDFIKNHLLTLIYYYDNQIDIIYKSKKYLRFLYGELFLKVKWYLEGNNDISDIIRYVLNKTDYKYKIEQGRLYNDHIYLDNNYKEHYKEYIKALIDNIDKYIFSLFSKNNIDIQIHYENILIKTNKNYHGFYIYKCENSTMEEFILFLFQEKLEKLPIAQNILFLSNETSYEEMKSFFYRAILCEYNTLFIIEIFESISILHIEKMFRYIDEILSYKCEIFKKANRHCYNINKLNTNSYLKSCIFFIYQNLKNESTLIYELEKYTLKQQLKIENIIPKYHDNNYKIEGVKIFSSEMCGLGKSFKIRKIIKENKEKYYYFSLGGKLSKNYISEKLNELLEQIKQEKNEDKNYNYNNPSIHLDIKETEDIPELNEFLFSFFITKFYSYNDDIIYIPSNIKIYVEIPNCQENYLLKIGLLKLCEIDNITLENLPKLELDEETKKIFNKIIGAENDEQIEKFIKNNIGIKNYSYHQIQIFIKMIKTQFNLLSKLYDSKNDDENKFIIKCCIENANIQDNTNLFLFESDNNIKRELKFIDPLSYLKK